MANYFCFSKNWSTFAHEMKKLMFLLLMAVWSVNSLAQEWAGVPENRFAPDRQTLFRLHKELAEALRLKGEPDFRLEELQACMQYAEEKDVNELTYMMAQCYFQLKQRDKAKEYYSKFLEATENKEYNDKIKQMRNQAQQSLRMMMW